ncbi:g1194 [Coccomyxa elongata]
MRSAVRLGNLAHHALTAAVVVQSVPSLTYFQLFAEPILPLLMLPVFGPFTQSDSAGILESINLSQRLKLLSK